MEELLEKELILIEEKELRKRKTPVKRVQITDKGLGFLQEYRRIREFTEAFGL